LSSLPLKETCCDATRLRDLRQDGRLRIQRESLEGAHAPSLRRESSPRRHRRREAPGVHAMPPEPDQGRAHGEEEGAGSPLERPVRATYAPTAVSTRSLWLHQDFRKLWIGQTISQLGSVVTRTAVPLVALLVLNAGPWELAILVIVASAGILLIGLVAGAWVDRLRRRPLLIWDDFLRAALLLSIPVAYAVGGLRIEQLYVVMFLASCLGALFDAAYPAYVPTLIVRDRLVDGNSKLATSSAIAEIVGLGLVMSAGGVGSLFGSVFASRVINRLGIGRALVATAIAASALGVLTPLAQGPVALATLMLFLPQLIGDGLQTIEGVVELSLIQ